MADTSTWGRGRVAILAIFAALAATLVGGGPADEPPGEAASVRQVIVSGTSGALTEVSAAVRSVGGRITSRLPIVDGVAASVPTSGLGALRRAPGVRSVVIDAKGHLMGSGPDPVLGYDVTGDSGSLYLVGQVVHAPQAWNKGWTGKGVDVALIDSGVGPVRGLTSGNVINGPDLSFESQDPDVVHLDTFGHGTHMASIIAGRDQQAPGSTYASSSSHLFTGMAPDARLVSIKVAASSGAADVSQVIAAIDWVTSHAHSDGLNIRVLNLSYGTDSDQDYTLDPLAYAVENAWRAGVVVVVAAGNDGTTRATLASPATDPLVLSVGADDPRGTASVGDDVVPAFSQHGTDSRHVDVVAPGVHTLGLRVPNGAADDAYPTARVADRFFRGSGTSQATAVVSGLAALYLSRYPSATPDQVKKALMGSATPLAKSTKYTGVGVPNIDKALGSAPTKGYAQSETGATGLGSLQAARGSSRVADDYGVLTGETDIFGRPWNASTWAANSASGSAWSAAGEYNGVTWTGATWDGNDWASHTWTDSDWTSHTWTSHTWTSHTWTEQGWDSHTWTDGDWMRSAWDSSSWDSSSWASSTWASSSWE
jgi:serine protease AprX